MGQKLEGKFWQKLRLNLGLEWIRRLENEAEPGWPDTHYIHNGEAGWIELKAEEKFPNKIKYQPAQPNWLTRYWSLGGTCYTMLYVVEDNSIYIWSGKFARELGKPGGTKKVKPMLVVKCTKQGWKELYDMF